MMNTMNISNGFISTWKAKLHELSRELLKSKDLKKYYQKLDVDTNNVNVHLAIFNEPFLSLIFAGKKTIESRFSKNKISPFYKAKKGDIVFIKKSGGAVLGYFIVGDAHYYNMPKDEELKAIKNKYSEGICTFATSDFWERRISARYISLLEIVAIKKIHPFSIDKKDRQAWAIINNLSNETT